MLSKLLLVILVKSIAADYCTEYTKCRRELTEKFWKCSQSSQRLTQYACRMDSVYKEHQITINDLNSFIEECLVVEITKKSKFIQSRCNVDIALKLPPADDEGHCWSDLVRQQQHCFALARCCPIVNRCTDHIKYKLIKEQEKKEKENLNSLLTECQADMVAVLRVPLAKEDRQIAMDVKSATTELLTSFIPFEIKVPKFAIKAVRKKSVVDKTRSQSQPVAPRQRYLNITGRKANARFYGDSKIKPKTLKRKLVRTRKPKGSDEKRVHTGNFPRNDGKLVQVKPSLPLPTTRGSSYSSKKPSKGIVKKGTQVPVNVFYTWEKSSGRTGKVQKHVSTVDKIPMSSEGAGMLPEMKMVKQNEGKFLGFVAPQVVALSDGVPEPVDEEEFQTNTINMIYDDLVESNLQALQGKIKGRRTKSIVIPDPQSKLHIGTASVLGRKKIAVTSPPTLEDYLKGQEAVTQGSSRTFVPDPSPLLESLSTTEPAMEAGVDKSGAWTMLPMALELPHPGKKLVELPTYPKSLLSATQPKPAYVLVKNGEMIENPTFNVDGEESFIFRSTKNDTRRRKSIEDVSGEIGEFNKLREVDGYVEMHKEVEFKPRKNILRTTMSPTTKQARRTTIWATSHSPTAGPGEDYIDISDDGKDDGILDITTTRKQPSQVNPTLIPNEVPFSSEDLLQEIENIEVNDDLSSGERIDRLWPFYKKARFVARSVPIMSGAPVKLPKEHPESAEMVEMSETPQCTKLVACMREEIRMRENCTQKIPTDSDECSSHVNYLNDVLERNELHLINFVAECIGRKRDKKDQKCLSLGLEAVPDNIGSDCSKLPQLRAHCAQLSSCCRHGCEKEHTRSVLVQKAEKIEKLLLRNVEVCEARKKKASTT